MQSVNEIIILTLSASLIFSLFVQENLLFLLGDIPHSHRPAGV